MRWKKVGWTKKITAVVLAAVLAVSIAPAALASDGTTQQTTETANELVVPASASTGTKMANITANGVTKKYYIKDGTIQTASAAYKVVYEKKIWQIEKDGSAAVLKKDRAYKVNIDGTLYVASKNGVLKTGWKTIGKKKYYTIEGVAVTGKLQKVGKYYYFFKDSGVMATKDIKYKKITYYLNKYKRVEAYQKGSKYYYPKGKKMTRAQQDDYTTLRTARQIVAKICSKKVSKKANLERCFKWVIKKPYITYRTQFPVNNKAWAALYANDHFLRRGGNCHSDAAAFAYLARALGYTDVYVCLDSRIGTKGSHGFTMIDGKYYDPLFAQAKSYSKYWSASSYTLSPITKVRIAVGFVGDK